MLAGAVTVCAENWLSEDQIYWVYNRFVATGGSAGAEGCTVHVLQQEERLVNTRRTHQQLRQQGGVIHGAAVGSRVRYCCCGCSCAT